MRKIMEYESSTHYECPICGADIYDRPFYGDHNIEFSCDHVIMASQEGWATFDCPPGTVINHRHTAGQERFAPTIVEGD